MPKYEYACRSCDDRFEVTQSFSDDPLTECQACGGPLRKVFSAPAITFKGSGFYRTDNIYRRTDGKADASSSTETKSEKKAEPAKSDSAPASDGTSKAAEAKTA